MESLFINKVQAELKHMGDTDNKDFVIAEDKAHVMKDKYDLA